jgi:hypothetical protein
MLHILLSAFALTILWSETPSIECNRDFEVWGCLKPNQIVVGYNDPDHTIYHELGHALFLRDEEVKEVINKYPPPRYYPDHAYPTAELKLDERVADYFVMYSRYPDFPDKFPEVNELFNNKLKPYEPN